MNNKWVNSHILSSLECCVHWLLIKVVKNIMGVHFKSITALNFWVKIISIPVFQINMHYEK